MLNNKKYYLERVDMCDQCGVENNVVIKFEGDSFKQLSQDEWNMISISIKCDSRDFTTRRDMAIPLKKYGFIKVILTIAYRDHNKTNNKFYNLTALCQKCLLKHDMKQYIKKPE